MRLYRLGFNELEIATITGHSPDTVRKIIASHYWERDSKVAAKVIACRPVAAQEGDSGRPGGTCREHLSWTRRPKTLDANKEGPPKQALTL